MSKRFIGATMVALLITAVLSACSITDHKNLSGNAARDAATAVVENSIKTFAEKGGTETLSVAKKELVLIYAPSAPKGKQVVTANLADKTPPTFDDPKSISINALKTLLASDIMKDAEFKLSDNVFTITGKDFVIELHTQNDLVMTSVITGKATGSSVPQIVVSAYGISKEAKKLFDSAVEPATAQ
ncbi:hypothetical protein [Aurantimicrobium sp.]|uniref:hypothetical protein n=1 Tax=Aurantimicrobium sp. TaxID=1930784 RepID=UPI002FCBAF86